MAQFRPSVGRWGLVLPIRPNCCGFRPILARVGPNPTEFGVSSTILRARVRKVGPCFGQFSPCWADIGPTSANLGLICFKIGPGLSNFGPSHSDLWQCWARQATFEQILASLNSRGIPQVHRWTIRNAGIQQRSGSSSLPAVIGFSGAAETTQAVGPRRTNSCRTVCLSSSSALSSHGSGGTASIVA